MFALIVVDQQKGVDHPKLGQRNNIDAERVMLALLRIWRKNSWPIFHIQHRSNEPQSVFWPDQDGFQFKLEFEPRAGEEHLEKTVPCAFTGTRLQAVLNRQCIRSIVLVGVATNNSIESTARTGGCLGFDVLVIEDACFTFDKADYFGIPRSASEVHAMSLANLHGEYATVLTSESFMKLLETR